MKNSLGYGRKLFWSLVFVCASICTANAMASNNSAIYILLNTETSNAKTCWNSSLKNYVEEKIAREKGSVYCTSYDLREISPIEFAQEFSKAENSILDLAQKNWFENSENVELKNWKKKNSKSNFEKLKSQNPEMVPLQFILVVEGASGLAVREYIQSKNYQGEFVQVLFFNTPHEGTGFADQALFNQNLNAIKQKKNAGDVASLMSVALTGYLLDKSSLFQEFMLTLASKAVNYAALKLDDSAEKFLKNPEVFSHFNESNQSLWYLAQDADLNDLKYKTLIENAKAKNIPVENYLGSTQLLNSREIQNLFLQPNYNLIYSYGMPTIGNGRRTLADYFDQSKNHIPQEKLEAILADSLQQIFKGLPNESELISNAKKSAQEILAKGKIADELKNQISDKLSELKLGEFNQYVDALNAIRELEFDSGKIPQNILKILSFIEKIIPDGFKSELYSSILEYVNQFDEIKNAAGNLKSGMNLTAQTLSNYAVNFFDEGSFDVPNYSAMAKNVAVFQNAPRFGYPLNDIAEKYKEYENLKEYQNLISDIGKLESTRKKVDVGLKAACNALNFLGRQYKAICQAAEFGVNIAMLTENASRTKSVLKKAEVLKNTKYMAVNESFKDSNKVEVSSFDSKNKITVYYSDLENFLFYEPKISIVSEIQNDSIIPLLLKKENQNLDSSAIHLKISKENFEKKSSEKQIENGKIPIQKVEFEKQNSRIYKRVKFSNVDAIAVTDFIQEFHFQIDDLEPDSLWWIRLDFNTKIQIAFQRMTNGKWILHYGVSYDYQAVDTLSTSPILKNGQFKISLNQDVLDKVNRKLKKNDKVTLSALEEDDVNVLYVSMMNKLGFVGSQKLSFYFQATDILFEEKFPKSFDVISSLEEISGTLNNLDYPIVANSAYAKISRLDSTLIFIDSVKLNVEKKNENIYALSANLKSLNLSEGEYFIEWIYCTKNTLSENVKPQKNSYKSFITVDKTAPHFKMELTKNLLNGRETQPIGFVKSLDTLSNRSIRALRVLAISNQDTVTLLKTSHKAEEYYDFKFPMKNKFSGKVKILAQAFDYTKPNFEIGKKLDSLRFSEDVWNFVVNQNGNFIEGINGTMVESFVLIDNEIPTIAKNSLKLKFAKNEFLQNKPSLKRNENILNDDDTLKIAFQIQKKLTVMDSADLQVNLIFEDALQQKKKSYLNFATLKNNSLDFTFEEPMANRLEDGLYNVNVQIIDDAGNIFENQIFENLKVDRTSPDIESIFANDIVFDSASQLNLLTVKLNQSRDLEINQSDLQCYMQSEKDEKFSQWIFAKKANAKENYFTVEVPQNLKSNWKNGLYNIHFGCLDQAGNFEKNHTLISIGKRYPEITYPNDSIQNYYSGKILISGIAPNPELHANDNFAEFKIEYRAAKDSIFTQNKIDYLKSTVDVKKQDLAIWNAENFNDGEYILRLSTRACKDSCEWVSTEKSLVIYSENLPKLQVPRIAYSIPKNQIVGDLDTVKFEFKKDELDTTNWVLNAKLEVLNDSVFVPAKSEYFNPVFVSPFCTKPNFENEGLTVWQDSNDVWNLLWKGNAQGIFDSASNGRLDANLSIKYLNQNVKFLNAKPNEINDSVNVPAIKINSTEIPAYNRISKFNLQDSLFIQIQTNESFVIDLSSVENAQDKIYSGKFSSEELKVFGGVLYIHPSEYQIKIPFHGLTQTGLYPNGNQSRLKILAYSKSNPGNLFSDTISWLMNAAATKIVSDMNDTGTVYIGFVDSTSLQMQLARLGYEFGIVGRSSFINAEILNAKKEKIKTLLQNKYLAAGTSRSAYKLTWNGETDNHFAETEMGMHYLKITAKDVNGKILDEKEYAFNVKFAGGLVEAPGANWDEGDVNSEFPAALFIDESYIDKNGDNRFEGNLDYELRTNVTSKFLAEKERTFHYKWDLKNGYQYPAVYKKYRYSVGIHRHRSEFPVTVAVLLASQGYDFYLRGGNDNGDRMCFLKNKSYPYRIKIDTLTLNENSSISGIFEINLDADLNIVGYKESSEPYTSVMEVKIFPRDVYKILRQKLDNDIFWGYANEELKNESDDYQLTNILNSNIYDEHKKLYYWFNNFGGQVVYWHDRGFFNYQDSMAVFFPIYSAKQVCSVNDKQVETSICGSKTPKEEKEDSLKLENPHYNMLEIRAVPLKKKQFGTSFNAKHFSCHQYKAAGDIKVKLHLQVKQEYWNPKWGYNNLANRFVRFDPTNKTLFGNEGYFESDQNSPNFFDGISWKYDSKGEDLTAVEAARLKMRKTETNPLLFADELSGKYIQSNFDVKFFNTENSYAVTVRDSNFHAYGSVISNIQDSQVSTSVALGISPLNILFDVAPILNPSSAIQQDSSFRVPYPYTKSLDSIILPQTEKFLTVRYYPNFLSRVHFGLNDWNDSLWLNLCTSVFCQVQLMRNPVTDSSLANSSAIWNLQNLPQKNFADSTFSYTLKPNHYQTREKLWQVPFQNLRTFQLDHSPNDAIHASGNLKLVKADSSDWKIETDNSTWKITNVGVDSSVVWRYIYSLDKKIKDKSFAQNVPLENVAKQNLKDSIYSSLWFKQLKVSDDSLFLRSDSRTIHPYLKSKYDSIKKVFEISKNQIPLNSRIEEIATIRGRVPGENQNWELYYSKDGALYPITKGVQEKQPKDSLPILYQLEMNRLQGNTSFFLTYGSKSNQTYFRKFDLHVGKLVNENDTIVHSMYRNLSIHFPKNAWENPTDVTVRTIGLSDYNFNAFENLEITGPILELLPSHDFGDDEKNWPQVEFQIDRISLEKQKQNPQNLKIYKPNFETKKIIPLETQIAGYLDEQGNASSENENWAFVKIVAKTKTFSTFFAMDSSLFKNVKLKNSDSAKVENLVCNDFNLDTIWAGTSNGYLELPYPCRGKSNYLLQLYASNNLVAEHQEVSANPIAWKMRNSDISESAEIYRSQILFYGEDNSSIQKMGPYIRIDSIAPQFENVEYEVLESGNDRLIQTDISLNEKESGIAKVTYNFYFAGNLIESRVVSDEKILAEDFVLDRKSLNKCIGCKAVIKILAEDYGHNFVKTEIETPKLYPYPMSLAYWWPLSEGAGETGFEILESGKNFDLSKISKRWLFGSSLYLYAPTDETMTAKISRADSIHEFSLEMNFKAGYNSKKQEYSIVGKNGENAFGIGLNPEKKYFVENGSERKYFNAARNPKAFEHFVFVMNRKKVSLYKNGEFVQSLSFAKEFIYSGNGKFILGNRSPKIAAVGQIKDLRFYTAALNAEQIRNLYEGILNLEHDEIYTARAADLKLNDLTIDQSCAAPGRRFVRQKNSSGLGFFTWNVYPKTGNYNLYLLLRNFVGEESKVEIFVNGGIRGTYTMHSTGLFESQKVEGLTLGLSNTETQIEIRPLGNLSIAGIALVNSEKEISPENVDYGAGDWKTETPKVQVEMDFENPEDKTWARPKVKIKNLTNEIFAGTRLRYYYRGEGEDVQAVSFYPNLPMTISSDAGSVYYAELTFNENIPAYGSPYFGEGPKMGLHRNDYYFPWNTDDDPSSLKNENGDATGVLLLDEMGHALNEFACFDEDGVAKESKKSVRVLAKDVSNDLNQSSNITMLVENIGSAAIQGFETRYYYRDTLNAIIDVYNNPFAKQSVVYAGGDLYYVSFIYENEILNPKEKSDFGNGVQFALHYENWQGNWNANNDPSHAALTQDWNVADSIVALDLQGNILFGFAPQPQFSAPKSSENKKADLLHRMGKEVIVKIAEPATYTLELVNAVGIPLETLYYGFWNAGEHSVSVNNREFPGSYLVLRKGTEILTWELFH